MSGISPEMRAEMLLDEVRAAGPEAVALYEQILANGETQEWAAMCALKQPSGSRNTDRAFCQGAARQMSMMAPVNRDEVLARAAKAGIKTQGKFYKGSLGRPDDPAAWVSSADDVLAVAKAKNLSIEGVIKHNAPIIEKKPKRVRLAPDLVRQGVTRVLRSEPDTAAKVKENPKTLREIVERVIDKHGSKKKT